VRVGEAYTIANQRQGSFVNEITKPFERQKKPPCIVSLMIWINSLRGYRHRDAEDMCSAGANDNVKDKGCLLSNRDDAFLQLRVINPP
jgi:hypothetical protein